MNKVLSLIRFCLGFKVPPTVDDTQVGPVHHVLHGPLDHVRVQAVNLPPDVLLQQFQCGRPWSVNLVKVRCQYFEKKGKIKFFLGLEITQRCQYFEKKKKTKVTLDLR